MNGWWTLLIAGLWVGNYVLYNYLVWRGRNIPTMGFWFTIVILDVATYASLKASGVAPAVLLMPTCWLVGASATFLYAWKRRGAFRLDSWEWSCLVLTCLGLFCWLNTGNPRASLLIQAASQIIASLPFFRMALRGNETWPVMVLPTAATFANLRVVPVWAWEAWPSLIIPVVVVGTNLTSLTCAIIGARRTAG